MNNRGGMALVVALMTSFILLALVASLFWVIAATSRQSEYAKNSAIALNLAEAGTANAIYRLNYCGTDGLDNYPFFLSDTPFAGTSALITLPIDILNDPPYVGLVTGADAGISGALNGGIYYVGLINDAAGTDTIIAVGVYKGIRRILTVPLRGNSAPGIPRQEPVASPQGISEAFNKHAIYCDRLAANNATVNGNIVYADSVAASTFPTAGNWTRTKISIVNPPRPDRAYFTSIGAEPAPAAIVSIYTDPGTGFPALYDPDGVGPAPEVWMEAGPVFNFQTGDIISTPTQINGTAHFENNSSIQAYTQVTGNVEILNQATVNSFLDVAGIVNISGTPTIQTGNHVCVKGNTVNFDSGSLNIIINGGLIKAMGNISINHSGANTNPYLANFFANGTITIDNSTAAGTKIGNATTDVHVVGLSGVTLRGADIKGTCYSQTSIWLGVRSNNVQPNNKNVPALIMDRWGLGSGSTITIQTIGTTHNIDGLIYSGGVGSAIVISSGTVNINGTLVADGTVQLSAGTSINDTPTLFENANSDSDIFSNFSGGRRAYVPAWQGWRLK